MTVFEKIQFVRIPAAVLQLRLPARHTQVLSLVFGFNAQGMRLSNTEIAELFGIRRRQASAILHNLADRGLIRIVGATRRRSVYLNGQLAQWSAQKEPTNNPQLAQSTAQKDGQLAQSTALTCAVECTHNLKKKTTEEKTPPTPPRGECEHTTPAKTSTPRRKAKTDTPPPEGFNAFWKAYPRKVAKQAALKAWRKLNPDTGLVQTILRAVEQQKASPGWQKDGGRFIPYPATWLNGERWNDETPDAFEAAGLSAPITEARARELMGLEP